MYIKRHNKRFTVCWWLILDKDKTRKTREPFWTSYWLSNSHMFGCYKQPCAETARDAFLNVIGIQTSSAASAT